MFHWMSDVNEHVRQRVSVSRENVEHKRYQIWCARLLVWSCDVFGQGQLREEMLNSNGGGGGGTFGSGKPRT